jgi:hypothetical protein
MGGGTIPASSSGKTGLKNVFLQYPCCANVMCSIVKDTSRHTSDWG